MLVHGRFGQFLIQAYKLTCTSHVICTPDRAHCMPVPTCLQLAVVLKEEEESGKKQ